MLTDAEQSLLRDLEAADGLNAKGQAKLAELRGKASTRALSPAAGALESALQGATLGWSDEGQAALGAAYDATQGKAFGPAYAERQQALQGAYDAYRAERPWTDFAGNLAGGVATGGAVGKALGALSKVPAWLRYPASGAAAGAVAGAGAAAPDARLEGAGRGAAVGGVVGAAVPLALGAAKMPATAATRAKRALAQAIERDRTTPTALAAKLGGLPPEAVIADAGGPNVVALTEAAQSIPGQAKAAVEQYLRARQGGMADRMLEPIRRTFGSRANAMSNFFSLDNWRRTNARPAYERAYSFEVPGLTEEMKAVLGTPAGREAWRRAARIAANDTEWPASKIPSVDKVLSGEVIPDMRTLDYVKRGLADVVERHKDSVTGRIKGEEGAAVAGLERKFRDQLRTMNPDYGAALDTWSGPTQAMGRLREGQRFLNEPAEFTSEALRKLSDTDKAFFRMGVAAALENKIAGARATHDLSKFFDNTAVKQKLSAVFPDDESFLAFLKTVEDEGLMNRTYNTVLGNSRTAARQAAQADLAGGDSPAGALTSLATGRPVEAATSLLQWLAGRGRRQYLPGRTSEELAPMLAGGDRAAALGLLRELERPVGLLGRVPTLPLAIGAGGTGGLMMGR